MPEVEKPTEIRCPKCGGQKIVLQYVETEQTTVPIVGYMLDKDGLLAITNDDEGDSDWLDQHDESTFVCVPCGAEWTVPMGVTFKNIDQIEGGLDMFTIMRT